MDYRLVNVCVQAYCANSQRVLGHALRNFATRILREPTFVSDIQRIPLSSVSDYLTRRVVPASALERMHTESSGSEYQVRVTSVCFIVCPESVYVFIMETRFGPRSNFLICLVIHSSSK